MSTSSARAVSRITGTSDVVRSWRSTSIPSIPGIITSSTTRSGCQSRAVRSAASPSRRLGDLEAVALEVAANDLADPVLVVDDENPLAHVRPGYGDGCRDASVLHGHFTDAALGPSRRSALSDDQRRPAADPAPAPRSRGATDGEKTAVAAASAISMSLVSAGDRHRRQPRRTRVRRSPPTPPRRQPRSQRVAGPAAQPAPSVPSTYDGADERGRSTTADTHDQQTVPTAPSARAPRAGGHRSDD